MAAAAAAAATTTTATANADADAEHDRDEVDEIEDGEDAGASKRKLRETLAVADRLVYQNTSQHRRTKHWRCFLMARAATRRAMRGDAQAQAEAEDWDVVTRATMKELRTAASPAALRRSAEKWGAVLEQLASSAREWNRARECSLAAVDKLAQLIANNFYLSFAVVSASVAASFARHAAVVFERRVAAMDAVIVAWLQRVREVCGASSSSSSSSSVAGGGGGEDVAVDAAARVLRARKRIPSRAFAPEVRVGVVGSKPKRAKTGDVSVSSAVDGGDRDGGDDDDVGVPVSSKRSLS